MVLGLFSTTASPVMRPLMFAGPMVRRERASRSFGSDTSAAKAEETTSNNQQTASARGRIGQRVMGSSHGGRKGLLFVGGCLLVERSPFDGPSDAGGLGLGVDPGGDGDVLDGDAERFEQGDVLRAFAPAVAADDHLPQLVNGGPVD